jgi:hypothetical protein
VILTMRGGGAGAGRELTERGLALLDRALVMAGAPGHSASEREAENAEARLLAAGTFIAVPDAVFRRFDQGLGLLQAELAGPGFAQLSPRLRAHVHYQASLAARKIGRSSEEAGHLRAYAELAPGDDPFAPVVRARLAEVER